MFEQDPKRRLRVGLFTGGMLVLLGFVILLLGEKQQLFVRHVRYQGRFNYVGGLVPGAPVWLNGVVVGSVEEVLLPSDPAEAEITVVFRVAARVANRVRADSRLRIRTLGLLGDRYLELTSGSPKLPRLEAGGLVPSEELTDIASVITRGGDAMTNVQAITSSLRRVLERVERGEGILGQLTVDPESGRKALRNLYSLLDHADGLVRDIRAGKGVLGKLAVDPELEARFAQDVAGMTRAGRRVAEILARDLQQDDSLLAGLLRDPDGRKRLQGTLDRLGNAAATVTAVGKEFTEGEGTLKLLLEDKEFARDFLEDLRSLTKSMRSVVEKVDLGEGSAGKLVNDPQLYEDLENVVRGVQSSRTLKWLIKNRREAGERDAQATAKEGK